MPAPSAIAAVVVRFDDVHGWLDTRTGVPLSTGQASALGLATSRTVDTPAGPVEVPAGDEVHYWPDHPLSLDHPTARLVALVIRRACEGGCGQDLDTPLRCWAPNRRPVAPRLRRRCALCSVAHTAVVLDHAHGALAGPHRHDPATGTWIGAAIPASAP